MHHYFNACLSTALYITACINYNCYSASLLQCCLSTALYITQQCIQIIIIVTVHHYFNACLSTVLYITQQCIQIIIIVTVHPSLLQCLLVHSIIYYTAVHTNNYNCYSASFITSMFACPQYYILHSSAYK